MLLEFNTFSNHDNKQEICVHAHMKHTNGELRHIFLLEFLDQGNNIFCS